MEIGERSGFAAYPLAGWPKSWKKNTGKNKTNHGKEEKIPTDHLLFIWPRVGVRTNGSNGSEVIV